MKAFQTFITEARTTKASQEAKRLGLVGDGHGDWYDRTGKLIAKTVAGNLKYFGSGGAKKDEGEGRSSVGTVDRGRGTFAKDIVNNLKLQPPKPEDRRVAAPQQGGDRTLVGQAKDNGPLTIAFDKFDDEEISNNLISTVEELSKNRFFYIFPSRESNIEELKNAYPKISESIIDDTNAETIYDVLQSLYENGFDAINIVVRKSRAEAISKLAYEQNGELYNFVMLNVIPAEERTIREQYIAGDIFKVGSMVESRGKEGKVIRRGANHLICLDEDQNMFRCWVSEAKESHFMLPVDF